ncbi:MAG: di-heme oxidoredictase family protein [Gemmataceae bacterium]
MRLSPKAFMNLSLNAQRKAFLFGGGGLLAFGVFWTFLSGGMPVWFGPTARASEINEGRMLFEHEWQPNDPLAHGDGLGPVYNAKSCASCHFQGGLGGGGSAKHNAVGFEILPRPQDHTFLTGTIHNFSVNPAQQESLATLKRQFPTVKGRTVSVASSNPHCGPSSFTIPDFDPIGTESVQTTALFGAGWIDLISDKAILKNKRARAIKGALQEFSLNFDSIPVGQVRVLSDGRVGKFGWKGQFASLGEFVAAACANEIGLGTPISAQAKPMLDPNADSAPDLDAKQFRSLVSFVKTLPKPVEELPTNPADRDAAMHGKKLFKSIGCSVCHVPDMGGVKGVYSDFLLYDMNDPPLPGGSGGSMGSYNREPPPELQLPPRPEELPKSSEWKTPPLWGVADSAPYWHDGSAPTLGDAIRRHRGDGKVVTEAYAKLSAGDQAAVIAFLKTLKAPPSALPLSDPSITKLTRK